MENHSKVFFLYRRVLFPNCLIEIKTRSDLPVRPAAGDEVVVLPVRNMLGLAFTRGRIGVLSRVEAAEMENDKCRVRFKGICRVRVKRVTALKTVRFERLDGDTEKPRIDRIEELRKKAQELVFLVNVEKSDTLIRLLGYMSSLRQLTDFIANYFIHGFSARARLLKTVDEARRAAMLIRALDGIVDEMKNKRDVDA